MHTGELNQQIFEKSPIFNFDIPMTCPGVPSHVLNQEKLWENKEIFMDTLNELSKQFITNYSIYENDCSYCIDSSFSDMIKSGGPSN